MYAKLENNNLIYAPNPIVKDGKRIYNPSSDMLEELGYKPVISTAYPQDDKHYKQGCEETETEIRVVWVDNEAEYWRTVPYDEAVSAEIRKKYSQDAVEAILNNFLADPTNELFKTEFFALQDYRAECKAFVKEMKAKYT